MRLIGRSIRCTITVFRASGLSGAPSGDGEGPGDEFRRSREGWNDSLGLQNSVLKGFQKASVEQIPRDITSKLILKFPFGVGGSGRRPFESADPARGPACGFSKRAGF